MNVRALWAAVALASVIIVCVTVLLALHVDITSVVAVVSMVGVPVIGAILYGKVETISQNTNGNTARLTSLIESLVEHLKTHNSVPLPTQVQTTVDVTPTPQEVPNGGPTL